jgi:CBS domain-containing protein
MDLERALLHEAIRTLELRKAVSVPLDATLAAAVATLQSEHVGCVLVVDPAGRLEGIFTERDLLTRVAGRDLDWSRERVSAHMTPGPETLRPEDPIARALHLMHLGGYRHVPLTDAGGTAVGVVSVKDVVDLIVELFPAAVLNLPPSPRRAPAAGGLDEE